MNRKQVIREFLLMNLGTLLVSVGVYFFKFPNNFSMGGVSGMAILLGELIPALSPSTYNTIINVLFLILGFLMLDKSFGFRTVYASIVSAALIQVFGWVCPLDGPLTDELMLELFFAVILPALGAAILFNIDASSGGTDIMAMILKKYTGMDVGRALLVSDVVIAAAALVKDVLSLLICALAIQWCYEYWCWTFPLRPTTSVYKLPLFVSQIPMCLSFVLWAVFLIRDCCTSFLLIKNSLADQKGTEEVVK